MLKTTSLEKPLSLDKWHLTDFRVRFTSSKLKVNAVLGNANGFRTCVCMRITGELLNRDRQTRPRPLLPLVWSRVQDRAFLTSPHDAAGPGCKSGTTLWKPPVHLSNGEAWRQLDLKSFILLNSFDFRIVSRLILNYRRNTWGFYSLLPTRNRVRLQRASSSTAGLWVSHRRPHELCISHQINMVLVQHLVCFLKLETIAFGQ